MTAEPLVSIVDALVDIPTVAVRGGLRLYPDSPNTPPKRGHRINGAVRDFAGL
jgi:hypothetical protein